MSSVPPDVVIPVSPQGVPISADLFGIFFEDLNYAADGGLYAELVQNRSFEYSAKDAADWHSLTGWEFFAAKGAKGAVTVESETPIHPNNPHYAVLAIEKGTAGLRNAGFDGIPIKAGEKYHLSLFARHGKGITATLVVTLESPTSEVLGGAVVSGITTQWVRHSVTIKASSSSSDARLVLKADGPGVLHLDVVSLFPEKTFHGRPNGLRVDLAETIAALKPKFVRFPGGCLAHGDGLDNMYRWKDTIGSIEERKEQRNIWRYHQTVGLGYFEYFQFCEDISAKPIPVVSAGVCCQNSGAHVTGRWGQGQEGLPLEKMPAYIHEVLDLIEWANGPASSVWGAKRAAAGHPKPFNLEYLAIGNEEHITPVFEERFTMIYNAIKARHPEIMIIGTVGPCHSGPDYEQGWRIARALKLPMVDEHYYVEPEWFWQNLGFYNNV